MRISTPGLLAAVTVTLCLGFGAGWWFRSLMSREVHPTEEMVYDQPPERSTQLAPARAPLAANESVEKFASDEKKLGQMLSEQRFGEATAFYYETVNSDSAKAPLLRPIVDNYLQRCFDSCESNGFLALVENWLATFYDDIPVLLMLARHQEQQGLPEAAANTLLLARTYALPGKQRGVSEALQQLTIRTDKRLSDEGRWIELLGYYEYLVAIDFTTPEFELRRALLYRRFGEQARGNELLANLRAAADGSDPEWAATLARHLAEPRTETAPGAALSNAIPLERRGDGYVVEVTLNDQATLKLLVDTGASMTALTRESFRRLARQHFSLLGTRLFNTANGYTRGDIYMASALTLGEERLEGTHLAVLDLRTMDDIDGLLGMNVLRQFHFEIDQSVGAMQIKRR